MTQKQTTQTQNKLVRTSASLPASVIEDLDTLMQARGFSNRSALLADIIRKEAASFSQNYTNEIMAGTFTMVYDHSVPGLQQKLNQLKHQYVAEIITSTQIQLMDQHTLEVNLMQGKAQDIKKISDEMMANRGVKNANLYLTQSALPPIYSTEKSTGEVK